MKIVVSKSVPIPVVNSTVSSTTTVSVTISVVSTPVVGKVNRGLGGGVGGGDENTEGVDNAAFKSTQEKKPSMVISG